MSNLKVLTATATSGIIALGAISYLKKRHQAKTDYQKAVDALLAHAKPEQPKPETETEEPIDFNPQEVIEHIISAFNDAMDEDHESSESESEKEETTPEETENTKSATDFFTDLEAGTYLQLITQQHQQHEIKVINYDSDSEDISTLEVLVDNEFPFVYDIEIDENGIYLKLNDAATHDALVEILGNVSDLQSTLRIAVYVHNISNQYPYIDLEPNDTNGYDTDTGWTITPFKAQDYLDFLNLLRNEY